MSETIRVIIADDHALIRTGIRLVLAHEADIRIVGEARNGSEVLELANHTPAEIILLDLSMPEMQAIEVIQSVQTIAPMLKIVIVSAYDDEIMVQAVVNAGVMGYFLKGEATTLLADMIRTVQRGATWFSAPVTHALLKPVIPLKVGVEALSGREIEVLHALVQGAANVQVARQLNLAEQTVRNYTSRIYDKLRIGSRGQAVIWAYANGFGFKTPEAMPFTRGHIGAFRPPFIENDYIHAGESL